MARERRMLSRTISISKKLSKVSDQAALLFSWIIPHVDDDGRIEGDPQTIKAQVVPRRWNVELVETYLMELSDVRLINYYKTDPENTFIEIIQFLRFQSFHGITRNPSNIPKFNQSNHTRLTNQPDLVDPQTIPGSKLNKTKLNKTKLNKTKLTKLNKTKLNKESPFYKKGGEEIQEVTPQNLTKLLEMTTKNVKDHA